MTDKIPSLKERLSKYTTKPSALAHPVLTLLYGQAGSGKTHLAATVSNLPHVKSVLYLDTEGSTTGALHGFDDSKFEIIVIPEVIKALNESGNAVTEIQFLDSIQGPVHERLRVRRRCTRHARRGAGLEDQGATGHQRHEGRRSIRYVARGR